MAEEKGQGLRCWALHTLRLYQHPFYLDRLAVGCLRKQPTGGEENRRLKVLEKVLGEDSESTVNCALLSSFAVTSRHFRDVRINQRIDSLPCPALFSMFPGRLARFLHGRGFTKLQRSACAGSNYGWIMREGGDKGCLGKVGCG